MAQTIEVPDRVHEQPQGAEEKRSERSAEGTERELNRFVAELSKMTPEERIRASRYTMNRREYFVYAARFPDEAPTVNGELERIALTLE